MEWHKNGVSATDWVISQNLRRRHLTPGQRAAVAVEAKPLLEAEAKQNQLAHLKRGKDIPRYPKNGKTEALPVEKTVAKQFDVSHGYVYQAQKIKDADDGIFQKVKAGSMSIPDPLEKEAKQNQKLAGQTFGKGIASLKNEKSYTPVAVEKTVAK